MFRICLLAATLVVSGCGRTSESDPVRETATTFVTALAQNDGTTACLLFSPRAVQRMRPDGCSQFLAVAGLPSAPVDSIEVWGDTAQAKTSADTLFLRKYPQGWRIVAAGCVPHGEEPYECEVDGT